MINPLNMAPLAFWKARRYREEDVLSLCRELNGNRLIGAVRFRGRNGLDFLFSSYIQTSKQGHALAWARYFGDLYEQWDGEPLTGMIGIWADDAIWSFYSQFSERAPLIAFGRTRPDSATLLVPDPAYMHSFAYKTEREEIAEFEKNYPWEEKHPVAFWRGANSDLYAGREGWENGKRIELCRMSAELNRKDLLDAAISKVVSFDNPEYEAKVRALGIVKDFIPMVEFFRYRYQIDIDGMHCAWISCFNKLSSQSCLLKVESENEQWYYHRLIPWKHYIPIAADLSNLQERIEWCQQNDDACREIAENGREVAESISYENSLEETGLMLQELFRNQDMN